ncbi:MAG: metal-dependent hydrolase [Holophagales bacterium]|nr:MAG: metal-dependent hydrolase [Holophagales bacterium]
MNPITHLLASWSLAEASALDERDRAVVAWVGAAPDLDGLGALGDTACHLLGWADPAYYGRFHHVVLHGLPAALLFPVLGLAFARRRVRAFLWSLAVVHLHLVADLLGSRGPTADDIWPIHYLGLFSEAVTVSWSGQWALNAWPNLALTFGLLVLAFVRATTVAHSPVSLFSDRAHRAFVAAVRGRWRQIQRRV